MHQRIEQELHRELGLLAVAGILQTNHQAMAEKMVDASSTQMSQRGQGNGAVGFAQLEAEQIAGRSGGRMLRRRHHQVSRSGRLRISDRRAQQRTQDNRASGSYLR
ncbi:MAG: hypothetical protein ACLP1D_03830 [Xanthobacteraceae bacterium]